MLHVMPRASRNDCSLFWRLMWWQGVVTCRDVHMPGCWVQSVGMV